MFLFVSYSSLYYEVFDLESKKAINPVNKLICWYVSLRKGKVKLGSYFVLHLDKVEIS